MQTSCSASITLPPSRRGLQLAGVSLKPRPVRSVCRSPPRLKSRRSTGRAGAAGTSGNTRTVRDREVYCTSQNDCSRRDALRDIAAATASSALGLTIASPAGAVIAPFCGVFEQADGSNLLPLYAFSLKWNEQDIKFEDGVTWSRVVGDPKAEKKAGKAPIVCVHGGPGSSARYLESLEALASQDRRVVFYDQYGCGFSTRDREPAGGYDLELFTRELGAVVDAYKLEEFHLWGHGWGGMLALEYLLRGPARGRVKSAVLAATPPSLAALAADRRANLAALDLPSAAREALLEGTWPPEAIPEDQRDALARYDATYVSQRTPQCITAAAPLTNPEVRSSLFGPSMFRAGGAMEAWDVSEAVADVSTPVLLTIGTTDEVSKSSTKVLYSKLPNAKVAVFEGGSCSHIDDFDTYLEKLNAFYDSVDEA